MVTCQKSTQLLSTWMKLAKNPVTSASNWPLFVIVVFPLNQRNIHESTRNNYQYKQLLNLSNNLYLSLPKEMFRK